MSTRRFFYQHPDQPHLPAKALRAYRREHNGELPAAVFTWTAKRPQANSLR